MRNVLALRLVLRPPRLAKLRLVKPRLLRLAKLRLALRFANPAARSSASSVSAANPAARFAAAKSASANPAANRLVLRLVKLRLAKPRLRPATEFNA